MAERRTKTGASKSKRAWTEGTYTEDSDIDSDSAEDVEEYREEQGDFDEEFAQGSSSGTKKRKRVSQAAAPKPTVPKVPTTATKRRANRIADASAAHIISKKASGKRRRTLSLFMDMPLDILYEILRLLSPKDLLSVYRTSSSFKTTLESLDAKTVWMEVRAQFNAPEPPVEYTEPQWARLLFEPKCQQCGKSNCQFVDWKIRKRLCNDCRKGHLLRKRDRGFRSGFQGYYDTEIFRYIPCTKLNSRDTHHHKGKLYWDADVHSVAERWRELRTASHTATRRAEFNAWKALRLAYVASCKTTVRTYSGWELEYKIQKADEAAEAMNTRKERIVQRFLALGLGYTSEDVLHAFAIHPNHREGTPNVTDRVWNTVRPKLEPAIQRAKNLRCETLVSRRKILDDLYTQYLGRLKSSERYRCPPPTFLHQLDAVWQVLEAPRYAYVTAQDFAPIVAQFPQLIAAFQADLKVEIASAVLPTDWSIYSSSGPKPSLEEAEGRLSLAKNVYRCEAARNESWAGEFWMAAPGSVQTLIDWTAIVPHHSCGECAAVEFRPGIHVKKPYCGITLHEKSTLVSLSLITLAGLDPATATGADMDTRDARFTFVEKSFPYWWTTCYMVFTWRGLLLYFAENYHRQGLGPPIIRLATEEETEWSQLHTLSLLYTARAWSCNHCQVYFAKESAETKSVIVDHIRERPVPPHMHLIANPQDNDDYVVNPNCWDALEVPCPVPLQFATSTPDPRLHKVGEGSVAS